MTASRRLLIAIAAVLTVATTAALAAPILFERVESSFQPTDGKLFVLVIGSDARNGNPLSGVARADAIHLVGVDTKTKRAGILNFPRDSWVPVPGYGSMKINEAMYHGGPDLLARTVSNLTGIEIDGWVVAGFRGFQGAVESIGRVRMTIPKDVYDPGGSGANLQAGVRSLAGYQALAYLRDRHDFAGGDIARSTHQGQFLVALLRKLREETRQAPSTVIKWVSTVQKHTRFNLSPDELFRLGILATQIDPKDVANVTVPVSMGSVGAASVVFIGGGAEGLYHRLRTNAYL